MTDKEKGCENACKHIKGFINSLPEEPVSIDFEQELYKAFGQVKDFTLGMRIAKRFYDMGQKSREYVSEDLEEASLEYWKYQLDYGEDTLRDAFKAGAQWQKQQILKAMDLGEPPYLISVEQAYYNVKKMLEDKL